MFNYTIDQWLFVFYIYCFFGWCFESTYVSICSRKLVNRGFMHGPFLPLYGSGAIMMLVVSAPFSHNLFLTYVAGCIGATILEYFTGAMMETLFKFRYWDYTNERFQYKGYICLKCSLFWGVLTIFMTRIIHMPVNEFVLMIPSNILRIVVLIVTIYLAVDFTLSFREALDIRNMLVKVDELRKEIGRLEERMSAVMAKASEQTKNALLQSKSYAGNIKEEMEFLSGNIRNLRPEAMEAWEEKIRRLQEAVGENKTSAMTSIRGEYRELKEKLQDSKKNMEFVMKSVTPERFYHLFHRTAMKSKAFSESLERLKEEVSRKTKRK